MKNNRREAILTEINSLFSELHDLNVKEDIRSSAAFIAISLDKEGNLSPTMGSSTYGPQWVTLLRDSVFNEYSSKQKKQDDSDTSDEDEDEESSKSEPRNPLEALKGLFETIEAVQKKRKST